MMILFRFQHFILPLALTFTAGCGEPPKRVSDAFFEGELRLTGELAQVSSGYIFISARPAGVRSPLLARRYDVGSSEFEQDGADKVLAYRLTEADSMVGASIALPPNVELKIYFDPDGMVETQDGVEAILVPVVAGRKNYGVELHPGMPVPSEPPPNLPGPSSGPASQPVNN